MRLLEDSTIFDYGDKNQDYSDVFFVNYSITVIWNLIIVIAVTKNMGTKILVVDDDLEFVDLCSKALESKGYTVEVVSTALSALKKLAHEKYPLVLIDLRLPGKMDGLDLLKTIILR